MKIALPTDDQQTIAGHFGRAQGFMVFTVEDNSVTKKEHVTNQFTGHALGHHKEEGHSKLMVEHHHHHHHGDGHHSHEGILNAIGDCNLVISRGMGKRLMDDFKQHNIAVVLTGETAVDEAVEAYLKGTLKNDGKPCNHHD